MSCCATMLYAIDSARGGLVRNRQRNGRRDRRPRRSEPSHHRQRSLRRLTASRAGVACVHRSPRPARASPFIQTAFTHDLRHTPAPSDRPATWAARAGDGVSLMKKLFLSTIFASALALTPALAQTAPAPAAPPATAPMMHHHHHYHHRHHYHHYHHHHRHHYHHHHKMKAAPAAPAAPASPQ